MISDSTSSSYSDGLLPTLLLLKTAISKNYFFVMMLPMGIEMLLFP